MNTHAVNFNITDHFKYTEPGLACHCCQRVRLITEFFECMELLEQMRVTLGFPIDIVSGYRCPPWNEHEHGEPDSMHMKFAADIKPLHIPTESDAIWEAKLHSMWTLAHDLRFGGLGQYDTWIHVDTRAGFLARWDERKKTV